MTKQQQQQHHQKQKVDRRLALFDIDEIEKGRHLGAGGFNEVYEISNFTPHSRSAKLKRPHNEARRALQEHVRSETTGETRFAIKYLKNQWADQEAFETAALDLATEAELMSSIDHPNILKLRGLATHGLDSFATMERIDGFFIILDRLDQTLAEKVTQWQKQIKSGASNNMKMRMEQLKCALEVASALEYLHGEGIIYRDLKPENIGIDARDVTKIFDFGLARELPEEAVMDDLFEMSGKIGTARYMSPEVYLREPYNEKADVYSFAHVLWEILATEKPYEGFTKQMHKERVIRKGNRPAIDPTWPFAVHYLLKRAWDDDIDKRPNMTEIRVILETEYRAIQHICGSAAMGEVRQRRRASVFDWTASRSHSTLSTASISESERDDDIVSDNEDGTKRDKPHHSIDRETMTNEPRTRVQRRSAFQNVLNHFEEKGSESFEESLRGMTRVPAVTA